MQEFNSQKIFTFSPEQTEFSSNACVCACNVWKSDKTMYDAVKVIHHFLVGTCLFFHESKSAEFGYCDVYDSCGLCAVLL